MFNFQINPKLVHWDNEDTYIFVNPQLSKQEQQLIKVNQIPLDRKNMIWVGSSGTTAQNSFKLIGIKKNAFIKSAQSVCEHLKITQDDIWLSVLPRFHVAGLAVEARSYVSGCKINALNSVKFDAHNFTSLVAKHGVTVSSLVPTQVYELVQQQIQAPKELRCLYVGGAFLTEAIYKKAVHLNWPIVLTYGMTEAASSVASSRLQDIGSLSKPKLYLLNHLQAKQDEAHNLCLQGDSLATMQITYYKDRPTEILEFNKSEGLLTQDLVQLHPDGVIDFLGRKNHQIKVSGELVNINQMNNSFDDFKSNLNFNFKSKVFASKHSKYGSQLSIAVEGQTQILKVSDAVTLFNQAQPSFQKIKSIYYKESISEGVLSK